MSVVFVGHLPEGKILVTDAMVQLIDVVRSHRDCGLKDKIAKLQSPQSYCSLVGDETVLFAIQWLDVWYSQIDRQFEIFDPSIFSEALSVAEKMNAVYKRAGTYNDKLYRDQTFVYSISPRGVVSYSVSKVADKYLIQNRTELGVNDILMNYGGFIQKVSIDFFRDIPVGEYINVAIERIKTHHSDNVRLGKPKLNYDFQNRFSGAVIPNSGPDLIKTPFHTLDELIITASGGNWEMLECPPF
jgi:hypothetical protein